MLGKLGSWSFKSPLASTFLSWVSRFLNHPGGCSLSSYMLRAPGGRRENGGFELGINKAECNREKWHLKILFWPWNSTIVFPHRPHYCFVWPRLLCLTNDIWINSLKGVNTMVGDTCCHSVRWCLHFVLHSTLPVHTAEPVFLFLRQKQVLTNFHQKTLFYQVV